MTSDRFSQIVESLKDREYRSAFAAEMVKSRITFEIRANRIHRNLTQKELGQLAGMKQEYISRLENPNASMLPNLETLIRVASALDVALVLRFATFSELARSAAEDSPIQPSDSFSEDMARSSASRKDFFLIASMSSDDQGFIEKQRTGFEGYSTFESAGVQDHSVFESETTLVPTGV